VALSASPALPCALRCADVLIFFRQPSKSEKSNSRTRCPDRVSRAKRSRFAQSNLPRLIGLKSNSVVASSSGCFDGKENSRTFVKIVDLARLRGIYVCLTPAQRQYLQSIVIAGSHPLTAPVIGDLIELGLVCPLGDKFIATDDGRYVASLS